MILYSFERPDGSRGISREKPITQESYLRQGYTTAEGEELFPAVEVTGSDGYYEIYFPTPEEEKHENR